MAEIIKLQVAIDEASKKTSLTEIKAFADQLSAAAKITVKVDTSSLKNIEGLTATQKANTEATKSGTIAQTEFAEAVKKVPQASGEATKAIKSQSDGTKTLKNSSDQAGDSITKLVGKVALWSVATTAIYGPVRAFQDALTTLKEVDTQLVSIQKVTDFTDAEIRELTASAYEMASAFGRTADEVLSAATAFSRAGYTENLEELTELSILTQNVGDVTADTANEFLLAADAAWQLNGNATELNKILDGMNEVSNKNATDVGKLADGIRVAGSVFAQAGETAQTFTALVGTATAATQDSGSKMARGLRTVLMNIRQIKGETEDGELIDDKSIANAAKALEEYAGVSTMANGELRLASDVLGDLADKWEDLDSVAKSAIAEALGGKYQANVVNSLMGNWQTYEKMMTEYAMSAGSALKENEIYLDSWEAKTKVLTSTWVEFVSNMVNTDFIKGSIDVSTKFIELLDTGAGRLLVMATALSVASIGFNSLKGKIGEVNLGFMGPLITGTINYTKALGGMIAGNAAATASVKALTASMLASPLFVPIAAGLAIWGIIEAVDALTISLEEQKEIVADLTSEYDSLMSEQQRLEETQKTTGLNEHEANRLALLQAQTQELENQIALESQRAFDMEWNTEEEPRVGNWGFTLGDSGDKTEQIYDEIDAYRELENSISDSIEADNEKIAKMGESKQVIIEAANSLLTYREAGAMLSAEQEELLNILMEMINGWNQAGNAVANATDGMAYAASSMSEISGRLDEVESTYSTLAGAMEEYNQAGYITIDTFQALMELSPQHLANLQLENGQIQFNREAYIQLAAAEIDEMAVTQALAVVKEAAAQASLNAGNAAVVAGQQAASSGAGWNSATQSLWDYIYAMSEASSLSGSVLESTMSQVNSIESWANAAKSSLGRVDNSLSAVQTSSSGAASGFDNVGNSAYNAARSVEDLNAQAENIADQAWSKLSSAIAKLLSYYRDEIDDQIELIDDQIKALEEARDVEEERLTLEEKKLAIMQAEKDLLDAQSQRTIRSFNADTNQWEWIADEANVQKAETELEDAKDDLAEYLRDLAYEATIAELEAQKESIEAQYEAMEDQWKAIQKSVEDPAQDIADALADIAAYGTPAMKEAVGDVNGLLGNLGVSLVGVVGQITALQSSMSSYSAPSYSSGSGYSGGSSGGSSSGGTHRWVDVPTEAPAFNPDTYYSGTRFSGSTTTSTPNYSYSNSGFSGISGKFDDGGILKGRGALSEYGYKDTDNHETVLNPEMTSKILSPTTNEQFKSFTESLGIMFGMAQKTEGRPISNNTTSSSVDNGNKYYIGDIVIDQQRAESQPLSQILSVLPVFSNS